MNKNRLNILLLLIIVNSCVGTNGNEETQLEINYLFSIPNNSETNNIQKFNLSEMYSHISGFELNKDSATIGHVSKIDIYKNILFVLDSRYAKKLFAFDLEGGGAFLFAIGSIGKGPGEFLRLTDFAIDSSSDRLLLSDIQQSKISYFDLTGNFLESKKLKFTPLKIACKDDYVYFICNPKDTDDNVIKITNKNLMTEKEYLPFKDYPKITNLETGFLTIEDKLLLNYPNCDTIYQLDALSLKPYLAIKTKDKSFATYAKQNNVGFNNRRGFLSKIINNTDDNIKNLIIPTTYFEDEKIIQFNFMNEGRTRFLIKSKSQLDSQPQIGYLYNDFVRIPLNLRLYNEKYGTIATASLRAIINTELHQIENNASISTNLIDNINAMNYDSNPFIFFLN